MNILKQVIESEGLTQTEFAKISGISVGTLNRIANNKIEPTTRLKNKILKAMNNYLNMNKYQMSDIFPQLK